MFFCIFAHAVALDKGLLFTDPLLERLSAVFGLERGLIFGGAIILAGLGVAIYALVYWYELSFDEVRDRSFIKVVCAASFLTVFGFQTVFSSFLLYLIGQPIRQPDEEKSAALISLSWSPISTVAHSNTRERIHRMMVAASEKPSLICAACWR